MTDQEKRDWLETKLDKLFIKLEMTDGEHHKFEIIRDEITPLHNQILDTLFPLHPNRTTVSKIRVKQVPSELAGGYHLQRVDDGLFLEVDESQNYAVWVTEPSYSVAEHYLHHPVLGAQFLSKYNLELTTPTT